MGCGTSGRGWAVGLLVLMAACVTDDAGPSSSAPQPLYGMTGPDEVPLDSLPITVTTSIFADTPTAISTTSPDGAPGYVVYFPFDERDRNLTIVYASTSGIAASHVEKMFQMGVFNQRLTNRATSENADVQVVSSFSEYMWDGALRGFVTTELTDRDQMVPPINLTGVRRMRQRGPERKQCVNFAWIPPDFSYTYQGLLCEVMGPETEPFTSEVALSLLRQIDIRHN